MNCFNLPLNFLQLTIKNNLQVNDYKYLLYYYANKGNMRNFNIGGNRQLRNNEIDKIKDKLYNQLIIADEFFEKIKNYKNKKIKYIKLKKETLDWLIINKHTLLEIRLTLYIIGSYHDLNRKHTKDIKIKKSFSRQQSFNIIILLKNLFPNKKNSRQLKNNLFTVCDNLCKIKYSDESTFLKKYDINGKIITFFLDKKTFNNENL